MVGEADDAAASGRGELSTAADRADGAATVGGGGGGDGGGGGGGSQPKVTSEQEAYIRALVWERETTSGFAAGADLSSRPHAAALAAAGAQLEASQATAARVAHELLVNALREARQAGGTSSRAILGALAEKLSRVVALDTDEAAVRAGDYSGVLALLEQRSGAAAEDGASESKGESASDGDASNGALQSGGSASSPSASGQEESLRVRGLRNLLSLGDGIDGDGIDGIDGDGGDGDGGEGSSPSSAAGSASSPFESSFMLYGGPSSAHRYMVHSQPEIGGDMVIPPGAFGPGSKGVYFGGSQASAEWMVRRGDVGADAVRAWRRFPTPLLQALLAVAERPRALALSFFLSDSSRPPVRAFVWRSSGSRWDSPFGISRSSRTRSKRGTGSLPLGRRSGC